jgi:hypothetical protein
LDLTNASVGGLALSGQFQRVHLPWANCIGDADFRRAKIGVQLDLRQVTIKGRVDLRGTEMPDTSVVYLTDPRIGELVAPWTFLGRRLAFYEDLTTWSEQQRTYAALRQLYEGSGQFSDADACFFESQELQRQKTPRVSFEWIYLTLNKVVAGYGVRPSSPLKAGVLVVMFFSIIYMFPGGPARNDGTTSLWLFGIGHGARQNAVLSIATTLFRAVVVSGAVFTGWGANAFELRGHFRSVAAVQALLGWFVLALFITTYSRVILR